MTYNSSLQIGHFRDVVNSGVDDFGDGLEEKLKLIKSGMGQTQFYKRGDLITINADGTIGQNIQLKTSINSSASWEIGLHDLKSTVRKLANELELSGRGGRFKDDARAKSIFRALSFEIEPELNRIDIQAQAKMLDMVKQRLLIKKNEMTVAISILGEKNSF